jgi:hypothetical protein
VELDVTGTSERVLTAGVVQCIKGATRNSANAREVALSSYPIIMDAFLSPGDTLLVRVSARIGTNQHGDFCGNRHRQRAHSDVDELLLRPDQTSLPTQLTIALPGSKESPSVASPRVAQLARGMGVPVTWPTMQFLVTSKLVGPT